eukprot:3834031-Lingulodinium_polyedra.AAC.1
MLKLNKNANPETSLLAQCKCTGRPGCCKRTPRTVVRAGLRTSERPPNARRLFERIGLTLLAALAHSW